MLTAQQLIETLNLKPLPMEGGFYRETYRSDEHIPAQVLPARYAPAADQRKPKAFSTAIYYLLTSESGSFSAMHRVPSEEIFHFYMGDPLEMLLLDPSGHTCRIELGADIAAGQHPQVVVPRDVWQGMRVIPGGSYALLGTTVAPGFDFEDFEIGGREQLIREYPAAESLIRTLTR